MLFAYNTQYICKVLKSSIFSGIQVLHKCRKDCILFYFNFSKRCLFHQKNHIIDGNITHGPWVYNKTNTPISVCICSCHIHNTPVWKKWLQKWLLICVLVFISVHVWEFIYWKTLLHHKSFFYYSLYT